MATIEDKVDILSKDISEIKAALKFNGSGLIPSFEKHCEADTRFREDYYKFKRWVIGIFCFLIGSGTISLSIIQISRIN